MLVRTLFVSTLAAAALTGCSESTHSASGTEPDTAAPRAAEVSKGTIKLHLVGETLERNSSGDPTSTSCKLAPSAHNDSRVDLKSLLAEFEVSSAGEAGTTVINPQMTLVMPFVIKAGETKGAWGPLYLDNHRCESLSIKLLPTPPGGCYTTDRKVPCPAYQLTVVGVEKAG